MAARTLEDCEIELAELKRRFKIIQDVVSGVPVYGAAAPAASPAFFTGKKASPAAAGPKRQLPQGMLAWKAWVKHCKETRPENFEACSKEPERLQIAKKIKEENPGMYQEFVSSLNLPAGGEAIPASPLSEANKLAALRAAAAAKKAGAASIGSAPATSTPFLSATNKMATLKAAVAAKKALAAGGGGGAFTGGTRKNKKSRSKSRSRK